MRQKVETFRGYAWLEPADGDTFLVFAGEDAREVLGAVRPDGAQSHYLWRTSRDGPDLMTATGTKEAAVAAVLRAAREPAR